MMIFSYSTLLPVWLPIIAAGIGLGLGFLVGAITWFFIRRELNRDRLRRISLDNDLDSGHDAAKDTREIDRLQELDDLEK